MDIIEMQKWAFLPSPPDDIEPMQDLLVRYSGIPLSHIQAHLHCIRDKAWALSRAPFIGRWKFLRLADPSDACHRQVLFRLRLSRSKDAFLDLGCGLGQALRQLRASGVDASQLYGLDLNSSLITLGYELFQDKDKLGASFFVGDIVSPRGKQLRGLDGKVTIIHAGSFFHLFTWTEQLLIGKRIVRFLKPGTQNALIYGTYVGTSSIPHVAASGSSYLHNRDSFQRLWDQVGELTKTKWRVEVELRSIKMPAIAFSTKDMQIMNFIVYQIP